ncbi:MAG: hypothetical protein FJW20_25110 [Acidimicrobiia bacterium]|nr:hypothetical protein [Acidimicrobiia bacterium]
MNRLTSGLLVGLLHILIIAAIAGNYFVDRSRLARVWAQTVPYDPDLPIRGRYVSLRVVLAAREGPVKLSINGGKLTGTPDPHGLRTVTTPGGLLSLEQPIAFFIPEKIPDPSIRPNGEQLWVELSVPEKGPPRPVRLGVMKDGKLTPLAID